MTATAPKTSFELAYGFPPPTTVGAMKGASDAIYRYLLVSLSVNSHTAAHHYEAAFRRLWGRIGRAMRVDLRAIEADTPLPQWAVNEFGALVARHYVPRVNTNPGQPAPSVRLSFPEWIESVKSRLLWWLFEIRAFLKACRAKRGIRG
jgi:hypothetical protein